MFCYLGKKLEKKTFLTEISVVSRLLNETKISMNDNKLESLNFLSEQQVQTIARQFPLPVYVYDENSLIRQARLALSFHHAFGLKARFAMKANPNAQILNILHREGMQLDASSIFEVERAIKAGIPSKHILLTAQESPRDYSILGHLDIQFNATSLHQLESFGKHFPGQTIGIRINPGLGSGGTNRTNVGGPSSSFGIWKDHLSEIKAILAKFDLKLIRIHTHIGSGSDPKVWQKVAEMSLDLVKKFETVDTLNLGGGFKVARMSSEISTDLSLISGYVKKLFEDFYQATKRKIKLEIEPGTFITANAGTLIAEIDDISRTRKEGYTFLKINSGMTEVLRPSMYGAQHPLIVVNKKPRKVREFADYIVSGHCCESGDILTPVEGDPESLLPRRLAKADRGDLLVIEGVGAYCASMSAKNYNSFPEIAEVLLTTKGEIRLIRRRQTLEQMVANEVEVI